MAKVGDAFRTRTAPRPEAAIEDYRFAFASCQKFEDGYYTAHRHLADEDLRMVLFLGDYIYEGASDAAAPRPDELPVAMTLADYRRRYAWYRRDPDLQLVHRSFPWMVVWTITSCSTTTRDKRSRPTRPLQMRQRAAYQPPLTGPL